VQQLLAGSAIATEMLFACGALWKATPESTYKANSTYNDHPNNKTTILVKLSLKHACCVIST
jgi:hypothetical protein